MNASAWLDLYLTPQLDAGFLARFVIAHALAPARAAWSLPAPDPAEVDPLHIDRGTVGGIHVLEARPERLTISSATVGPVLRGLLLVGTLFPESVSFADRPPTLLDGPGWAFLDSYELAHRTAPQVAWMARGLVEDPGPPPRQQGGYVIRTGPNPEALSQLRAAKALLESAMGPVQDYGDYRRVETGLAIIDPLTADGIDEVLRRDVRRRLVSVSRMESGIDDTDIGSAVLFDHGVVSVDVPETLMGLVLLDWAEGLGTGLGAGRCALCLRPMALSRQQEARARKGEDVFHPDCHREHRLRYGRRFQRDRAARARGDAP